MLVDLRGSNRGHQSSPLHNVEAADLASEQQQPDWILDCLLPEIMAQFEYETRPDGRTASEGGTLGDYFRLDLIILGHFSCM